MPQSSPGLMKGRSVANRLAVRALACAIPRETRSVLSRDIAQAISAVIPSHIRARAAAVLRVEQIQLPLQNRASVARTVARLKG